MKARLPLTILTALLIFAAGYAALFVAPDEKTMHAIQRIFYFHLPSWIAMFSAFTIVFYANVAYLITRNRKWDALGVSGVEVGVICCTIGLVTGPLWARPVWGIWWTWDARLTSTFILWLLYIGYLLLRGLLEDPEKKASLSAIFGIFASLDIPSRLSCRTASGVRSIRNPSSSAAPIPVSRPRSPKFCCFALLPSFA